MSQALVGGWAATAAMQFVVPGCKEDPPLRAAGKMVHLTFAALYDGELTLEGVLNHARRWATTRHGLREYTIGLEEHSHPADPQRRKHIHAYLKFGKKIDITDRHHTKVFDLLGRHGRVLHPELQAVGSMPSDRERVINYDMKDGEYIGELETTTSVAPPPRRVAVTRMKQMRTRRKTWCRRGHAC